MSVPRLMANMWWLKIGHFSLGVWISLSNWYGLHVLNFVQVAEL
ncbi:hypothetical protein Q674_00460 [Acinetobacter sp. COS3]|nr:hypothetical protein Q674_00460 [Acinetobacter sp. COS3]